MRAALFVVVVLLLGAAEGRAQGRWLGDGEPAIGLVAVIASGTRPGDTLTVMVASGGHYYTETRARYAVHIPVGVQFISGDTLIVGSVRTVAGNHTLRLLAARAGHFSIRGELFIDAGSSGTKARVVAMEPARAPAGWKSTKRDTLRFVVVVDAHGRVRESHLVGGTVKVAGVGREWLAAGRAALARWQFEPARVSDQGVSDWLVVSVPVAQGK